MTQINWKRLWTYSIFFCFKYWTLLAFTSMCVAVCVCEKYFPFNLFLIVSINSHWVKYKQQLHQQSSAAAITIALTARCSMFYKIDMTREKNRAHNKMYMVFNFILFFFGVRNVFSYIAGVWVVWWTWTIITEYSIFFLFKRILLYFLKSRFFSLANRSYVLWFRLSSTILQK